MPLSLGGAGLAGQRPRHQAGLARGDERAAAVKPERRAWRLEREGAKTGPMEIAIRASWLGVLAQVPAHSLKAAAWTRQDYRGRWQAFKLACGENIAISGGFEIAERWVIFRLSG